MSQHTRKLLSARPGLVNEMPDVYTAGPQMFNELFNFPPGLELLGVPPSKADGVPGSKLNSYNNWRVLNGQQEQQYDYAGSFNSQKEANMIPQSLDAIQLYVLNSANRGNFSAPTISNGGIDHHQSSSHGNSIQFQLPAFSQSIANQDLCNIEQVPSRDSWQSGGGVNELLLLPTGNGDNLLNNNIQFIPPHQLNHTDWENGSLQASTSQWCEQSSLETKFGTRDERSVQGLSLSLASNPQVQETHAGLISTQDMANRLQATAHPKDNSVDVLNGYKVGVLFPFSRSEGILSAKGYWNPNTALSGQFTGYVKQSKYMKPTRQLLDEFCNVAGKEVKENFQNSVCAPQQSHQKSQPESTFGDCNINQFINQSGLKIEPSVSVGGKATAVMCNERLNGNGYKDGLDYSKERFELRRRKAKLVWMLDEVERRYRQYCEQMKIVGTSFDSAAGVGAATTYTSLAAKAMSRHFKCLKDAITGQIKATNDALGEKDSNVPGITKGETPRLKLIEQSLRQRRTFQQVGMLEHDAWRPQRGLPERAVTVLRAWLFEHFLHPYPSDADKHLLARQTGLSRSQVSNWFINARVRLWKPMVEEMYQEEARNAEMEEADTNSNHNKHEKNEVGATHSNRSVKGNVCREEEAAALVERKNAIEDNAKKVHVGGLEMSTYNGNGNMLHQQNISSTYYGSGDVTLTLGLRHNAHQEKYPNALCLPC